MTHPLLFTSVSAIMFVSAAAHADAQHVRIAYDHLADGKVILASEVVAVSGHVPALPPSRA
jgi:hypothetical protein